MIGLLIGLAVITAFVARGTELFVPAVVNAVASFWSNGVMANFYGEPDNAPDWAALVSIATTVAAVGLLIAALVIR